MNDFMNSDHNDQPALIEDEKLDTVAGGMTFAEYRAKTEVGGWYMRDIWTRPTLGRLSS